jgi:hypothetical protein
MAAATAMMNTPEMMYEMRSTITKLGLTEAMLAIIADMQLIPVAPVYNRRPPAGPRRRFGGGGGGAAAAACGGAGAAETEETWRRSAIVAIRRAPRVKDDADYEKITGLVNKVVASTVEDKAKAIHEIVKTRADDPTFRIRILNFIFDRGVSMPFFAQVLADLIAALCKRLPEMVDDLAVYCSVDTFEAMFQEATIIFPKKSDLLPEGVTYEDKICAWNKQRELRRGFGLLALELYSRDLVSEEMISGAIATATEDLEDNVRRPKDAVVIERVDQSITFIGELVKFIGVRVIKDKLVRLLAIPKADTPCLGMRSRFKLEDILRS